MTTNDVDQAGSFGSKTVAVAFLCSIVGGLILSASLLADTSPWFDTMGGAIFGTGAAVAVGAAMRASRSEGKSLGSVLAYGVKTLFRWLWAFFP